MSNIKINDVPQRIQYLATGGQTQFTIPFPFFQNNYVYVWLDGVQLFQGGAPGQYTVSGAGSPSGGLVTFNTAATLNQVVSIEGIMPIDRTSIYSATISNLTGSDLNGDFNREVVMLQQLNTTQSFLQLQYAPWALVSQDLTVTKDRYIPLLAPLEAWRMNAAGTAIEPFTTPSSGGLAPDDGTYLLQVADSDLPNAQVMGNLASGIVVNTTTTGVQLTRVMTGTINQIGVSNGNGIADNPTFYIANNPIIPGTAGMGIPSGTTAQRVVPGSNIGLRYNTDLQGLEFWDGVNWVLVSDNTDLALLASHVAGQGASLIGLQDQTGVASKTVQDLANAALIAQTDNGTLTNGQFLSALTTGFAYVTNTTGVIGTRVYTGTANQIDIANGSGAGGNPTASLSATLNLPGTFNIQGTNAVNAIINDSSMATATSTNLSSSSAIKAYVDSLVTGLNIQGSCVAGSTTALTVTYANGTAGVGATLTNAGAQAAIQLDGVSPTIGQRVLIKNQASAFQNGIYTVTTVGSGASNWVLTRATDYDTPAEITAGDLVILTGGTTQAQSSWVETASVATIGTDPITFVQFTASLPVNVSSGGTGVTSFTAYAPILGGTTTTGNLQSMTLGAAGTLFRSAGVGVLPTFTTTTYPATNAINTIMYASSANVLGVITPTNNGVLIYSGAGAPSSSTTLPSGIAATNMALTTPSLGVATATSINKVAITAPATSSTLTIADGKTLTQSNTLTYTGTDGSTVNFGAGGTVQYSTGSGGLKSFQVFTSGVGATYTKPAGITSILVEMLGGGGGGGGSLGAASSVSCGAGGGAGGYAMLWVLSASSSYTYTVGGGGSGGTAGNNAGSSGGTSTFSASSLAATGGAGGAGSAAYASATAGASLGGLGGIGSNGIVNFRGDPGLQGWCGQGNGFAGNGGSSRFGGGAQGGTSASLGAGTAATAYGSGGSGGVSAAASFAGGNGSPGLIIVWEFA